MMTGLNILITLITGYRWVRRITVRSIARYAEKSWAKVLTTFALIYVHTACMYHVRSFREW